MPDDNDENTVRDALATIPWLRRRVATALFLQILLWLVGSLWGYFVLALLLLVWLKLFTAFEPYTFAQLALWFDALAPSDKAALGSALITVVGFLVAFQTAYDNARAERLMNKEIEVADEIAEHYEAFQDHARALNTFAYLVRKTHDEFLAAPESSDFSIGF